MPSISQNSSVADLRVSVLNCSCHLSTDLDSFQEGIPQSPDEILSAVDASRLLSFWTKKHQDAKIMKRWAVAAYKKAQDQAIKAKQAVTDYEQAVRVAADIISSKGYRIIWESPKDGIFTPYILKIEEGMFLTNSWNLPSH